MATPTPPKRSRVKRLFLVLGVAGIGFILVGVGLVLVWYKVAAIRQRANAETQLRDVLDKWCSEEPLERLADSNADPFFDDPSLTAKLRPQRYEVNEIKPTKKGDHEARVTLTFLGGPETRVYKIQIFKKSGKCLITTTASEDISSTEATARSLLQAWLDSWIAGEDMVTFKSKHPEAAGKMTMDITWAAVKSEGKRLVRYEITNTVPRANGFRFTVTAAIQGNGMAETKTINYQVFKDRTLSEGRWVIAGS